MRKKRSGKGSPGGEETLGQRLARLRKARGITQAELATRLGTIQPLISDYETDRLRMNAELVVQIAEALRVSADELLGVRLPRQANGKLSLRLVRRLQGIERLPAARQKAVLHTIDLLLKGAGGVDRAAG